MGQYNYANLYSEAYRTSCKSYIFNLNGNKALNSSLCNGFIRGPYGSQLTDCDLKNLCMINNMAYTFYNCGTLKNLNVSNGDMSYTCNLFGTFYNCGNLTNLDTFNGNLQNLVNISSCFYNCKNLTYESLYNIGTALLTAVNLSSAKNLYTTNTLSPLWNAININNSTVGTDLVAQLRAAGGSVPE